MRGPQRRGRDSRLSSRPGQTATRDDETLAVVRGCPNSDLAVHAPADETSILGLDKFGLGRDDLRAVVRARVRLKGLTIQDQELIAPCELREDRARLRVSSEDHEGRGERFDGRQDERLAVVHGIRREEVRERPSGGVRDRRKGPPLPRDVDYREATPLRARQIRGRERTLRVRREQKDTPR